MSAGRFEVTIIAEKRGGVGGRFTLRVLDRDCPVFLADVTGSSGAAVDAVRRYCAQLQGVLTDLVHKETAQ